MSDYESDDEMSPLQTRGYLFEPEYTEEELVQQEIERAERERRAMERTEQDGEERQRVDSTWCSCENCKIMPTVEESYCCHEWNLVEMQLADLTEEAAADCVCITTHPEYSLHT